MAFRNRSEEKEGAEGQGSSKIEPASGQELVSLGQDQRIPLFHSALDRVVGEYVGLRRFESPLIQSEASTPQRISVSSKNNSKNASTQRARKALTVS